MFGVPELWWWGALTNLWIWFDLIILSFNLTILTILRRKVSKSIKNTRISPKQSWTWVNFLGPTQPVPRLKWPNLSRPEINMKLWMRHIVDGTEPTWPDTWKDPARPVSNSVPCETVKTWLILALKLHLNVNQRRSSQASRPKAIRPTPALSAINDEWDRLVQ